MPVSVNEDITENVSNCLLLFLALFLNIMPGIVDEIARFSWNIIVIKLISDIEI